MLALGASMTGTCPALAPLCPPLLCLPHSHEEGAVEAKGGVGVLSACRAAGFPGVGGGRPSRFPLCGSPGSDQ